MVSSKSKPNKRGSEKQEADAQLRKVGRYLSGKDIAGSADSKARGAQARKAAMIRGVYGDVEERRLIGKKAPAKAKSVPKQATRVVDKSAPKEKAVPRQASRVTDKRVAKKAAPKAKPVPKQANRAK